MTNYTATEVQSAVRGGDYFWTDLNEQEDDYTTAVLLQGEPVVMTKGAGKEGEYEDEGSQDIYVVVRVGSQFFKKTGYYTSYGGSTWNSGLREVKPEVKTILVFE